MYLGPALYLHRKALLHFPMQNGPPYLLLTVSVPDVEEIIPVNAEKNQMPGEYFCLPRRNGLLTDSRPVNTGTVGNRPTRWSPSICPEVHFNGYLRIKTGILPINDDSSPGGSRSIRSPTDSFNTPGVCQFSDTYSRPIFPCQYTVSC